MDKYAKDNVERSLKAARSSFKNARERLVEGINFVDKAIEQLDELEERK